MYSTFERLMKEKGVTATDVSRETGIARSSFTDWKKGRATPKLDKLQKLAAYFGVPLETLTGPIKDVTVQATYHVGRDQLDQVTGELAQSKHDFLRQVVISPGYVEGYPIYYESEETARLAQEALDNPDLQLLLDASRGLSSEDIRAIIEIAKRMKGTNPDG